MAYTASTSGHMGSWTANTASAIIVPENVYRDKLVIQMTSTQACSLAFGEAAVYAQGIQLTGAGRVVIVTGALAREAVYGICTAGQSAAGGYQENLGVCD